MRKMHQIKSFGVLQTSKVAAIILFFTSLIFMVPFFLMSTIVGGFASREFGPSLFPFYSGFILILMPFFYAVFGFIGTAISCLIYNFIAKKFGGIQLEMELEEPYNEGFNR
ncbi:hypothetical protein EMN47_04315 [Prolixibacteraceae bacterium JC049]|nr:hypothetical protein [Prolixibacteraceae bacterium JC049]